MSIPVGSSECSKCKVSQDNSSFKFYKGRISPAGERLRVNRVCNTCTKSYGQEKKIAERMAPPRPALPHPCDNCSKPIVTTKTLQLDHDHVSHAFRGWLCKECNISIGNLGDNVKSMLRAAMYLQKTEKVLTKEELSALANMYERLS